MKLKTVQLKEVEGKTYTIEELITSCEELGLFKIQKVFDGDKDTGLWTFEVVDL